MAAPLVKIADLYFRYKRAARPVFEHLRLDVAEGERLAVLGPSEAGKSTLALCLNGLIPHLVRGDFRGEVVVAGGSTRHFRPRQLASRVGVLFQDFEAQLFATRVDLEVAFGPENLGLPRAEIQSRVRRALALTGLAGLEARHPATLSGGQRQLLALAAVLALRPRLLVLDEPTTDLDPQRAEELLEALEELKENEGLTLMLLGEEARLARLCTRIILLHRGQVRADGPAAEVLRQVELWRSLGLRPPVLPALFHDLGHSRLPLSLEEAAREARNLGWDRRPRSSPPETPGKPLPALGPEILALREVSFAYPGSPPLFRNLSLSFREGELTVILGANGSGKTTLLKLLLGLLKPLRGEVWRPAGVKVGFIYQNPDYQIFAEEVGEEVALGLRAAGLPESEVRSRVAEALARVHLGEYAHEDPFSLTKGQRQRLAVATVLALRPQVIILDEPTTGLDHREQEAMFDLICDLHAQGHTILMVTHSLWAAARYARRLLVLHGGRVVLDGPPREVLAQEEILQQCGLRAPTLVRFSRLLGFTALTLEEFRDAVRPGGSVGRNGKSN